MSRHVLNTFIVALEVPVQCKNKSCQKTHCRNVLSYFLLELNSAIQGLFLLAATNNAGLWTQPLTAGEIVSFLSF